MGVLVKSIADITVDRDYLLVKLFFPRPFAYFAITSDTFYSIPNSRHEHKLKVSIHINWVNSVAA